MKSQLYDTVDIVFLHDQILFSFDGNLSAGVFSIQYLVAYFYIDRLIFLTSTNSNDLTSLWVSL